MVFVSHLRGRSQLSKPQLFRLPLFDRSAWNPYLRETTLRIFASAGFSVQLGRFTRPLLDFTSVAARLDVGMTSQQTGALSCQASSLHLRFPREAASCLLCPSVNLCPSPNRLPTDETWWASDDLLAEHCLKGTLW